MDAVSAWSDCNRAIGHIFRKEDLLGRNADGAAWGERAIKQHPRIHITGIEDKIGTHFSVDTLNWLKRRAPCTRFVWLMGSDNLASFHRWKDWTTIAALMPMAVIDRPGSTLKATRSRAATALAAYRRPEHLQKALLQHRAPAWIMLHDKRSTLSSTGVRSRQKPPLPR